MRRRDARKSAESEEGRRRTKRTGVEAEGWSGSTNPMATKEQKARRMRSKQANAPLLAMAEKLRNLRLPRKNLRSRLLRQPKEEKKRMSARKRQRSRKEAEREK